MSGHLGCTVAVGAYRDLRPRPSHNRGVQEGLQLLSKVLTLIVVCPWCSPNILACNCHGVLGEGDELASGEDIAGVNNTCN